VFHPAGPGVKLLEFVLGDGGDCAVAIEEDSAGTGGALVEGEEVTRAADGEPIEGAGAAGVNAGGAARAGAGSRAAWYLKDGY